MKMKSATHEQQIWFGNLYYIQRNHNFHKITIIKNIVYFEKKGLSVEEKILCFDYYSTKEKDMFKYVIVK